MIGCVTNLDALGRNSLDPGNPNTTALGKLPPTPSLPLKPMGGDGKEDGEIEDARRRLQNQMLPQQPPNLPQRPPIPGRGPIAPTRDMQQHHMPIQQQQQQQQPHMSNRPPTPRRDEIRPNPDVRRQEMNSNASVRNINTMEPGPITLRPRKTRSRGSSDAVWGWGL